MAQLRVQFLDPSKFLLERRKLIGSQAGEEAHHQSQGLLELREDLAVQFAELA
jgi:hypothetical protein